MAALCSRCGHYIFALWFLLLPSSSPGEEKKKKERKKKPQGKNIMSASATQGGHNYSDTVS